MIPLVLTGHQRDDGRFAPEYDAPLAPSAAVTASGHGEVIELGSATTLRLTRAVTALDGGASLQAIVEHSRDGSTDWTTAATFGTVSSAPATDDLVIPGLDRFARVRWVLTGTGATFSVTGTAVGGGA